MKVCTFQRGFRYRLDKWLISFHTRVRKISSIHNRSTHLEELIDLLWPKLIMLNYLLIHFLNRHQIHLLKCHLTQRMKR